MDLLSSFEITFSIDLDILPVDTGADEVVMVDTGGRGSESVATLVAGESVVSFSRIKEAFIFVSFDT